MLCANVSDATLKTELMPLNIEYLTPCVGRAGISSGVSPYRQTVLHSLLFSLVSSGWLVPSTRAGCMSALVERIALLSERNQESIQMVLPGREKGRMNEEEREKIVQGKEEGRV